MRWQSWIQDLPIPLTLTSPYPLTPSGQTLCTMAPHDWKGRLIREQGPLLALIASIFVIFAFQAALGPEWYYPLMTVPGAVTESWDHVRTGNATPADFLRFGTLLSSAFLHGDAEHVVFNMFFLWIFAALTVELLGQRWMVTVFAISAIAGSITHTLFNPTESIPMLGASGAVMGFEGAYLGMAIRWRLPDPHIWPMARPIPPANLAALAVIGILFDFWGVMGEEQTGIAYGAHIGGFVGGLFLTSFVAPRPRVHP